MKRRTFFAAAGAVVAQLGSAATSGPIIDTHAHFYNPARPGGVPWPAKDEKTLYRTVLPDEFVRLTKPFGVTGVIEVEASPLVEDNQWVLDLAPKNPIIIGTVGHLEPGKPGFRSNLERFHKNPLFLGIRIGYLRERSLAVEFPKPEFIADLKFLAGAGLEIDVVGGPSLLAEVVRITDQVPGLRIVVDHLPYDPPADLGERAEYLKALHELGNRRQVYAKVSNVLRRSQNHVPAGLDFYRPSLDELWDVFGPDRLIYGSNWPVSNLVAPYSAVFRIVQEYFSAKGTDASEKYFWKNSQAAYRWRAR
jgi:predicted TIM-barrel fold metal-dependent hydrolase